MCVRNCRLGPIPHHSVTDSAAAVQVVLAGTWGLFMDCAPDIHVCLLWRSTEQLLHVTPQSRDGKVVLRFYLHMQSSRGRLCSVLPAPTLPWFKRVFNTLLLAPASRIACWKRCSCATHYRYLHLLLATAACSKPHTPQMGLNVCFDWDLWISVISQAWTRQLTTGVVILGVPIAT
jgi:hypothetical protein